MVIHGDWSVLSSWVELRVRSTQIELAKVCVTVTSFLGNCLSLYLQAFLAASLKQCVLVINK